MVLHSQTTVSEVCRVLMETATDLDCAWGLPSTDGTYRTDHHSHTAFCKQGLSHTHKNDTVVSHSHSNLTPPPTPTLKKVTPTDKTASHKLFEWQTQTVVSQNIKLPGFTSCIYPPPPFFFFFFSVSRAAYFHKVSSWGVLPHCTTSGWLWRIWSVNLQWFKTWLTG